MNKKSRYHNNKYMRSRIEQSLSIASFLEVSVEKFVEVVVDVVIQGAKIK